MNAKKELLEILKKNNKTVDNIVAIIIKYELSYTKIIEINKIEQLDFNYYDGYGGQYLYGYVLLDDQDWLERHEYDGSEWWEYKKYPSYLLKEEK
jgi:hypothetical protein